MNPPSNRAPSLRILIAVTVSMVFAAAAGTVRAASMEYDLSGNTVLQAGAPAPAAPLILAQPTDALLQPGDVVRFSVVASGPGPLGYRWQHNGTDIPGADRDSLLLTGLPATLADYGHYRVIITTPGHSLASHNVTIFPDTNRNGIPDWWELQHFGDLAQSAYGDFDGDGVNNRDEWLDGTDPADPEDRFFRLRLNAAQGHIAAEPRSPTGRYPPGTTVHLRAHALGEGVFAYWWGDAEGLAETITVLMDRNRTINASFGDIPLPDALNNADLVFTTSLLYPWVGLFSPDAHDGIDLARSRPDLPDNAESWLQTTVQGPGTLRFHWSVSSQSNRDFLHFEVDGVSLAAISGTQAWHEVVKTFGPGSHTVRWRYAKDASGASGQDAGFVDAVSWTPETPPALEAALGGAFGRLLGIGPVAMTAQDEVFTTGPTAVESITSRNSQTTWLQPLDPVGPGTLTFWWRVDPRQNLQLRIDGAVVRTLTGGAGGQDWQRVDHILPTNSTLRWDHVSTTLPGTAWLDAASLTPAIDLATALDIEPADLPLTTGGDAPWLGAAWIAASDGVDAARSGAIGTNQESWIETTVTGPGTLAFNWRVSSRTTHFLRFEVDGVVLKSIAGEQPWESVVRTFGPGTHTVRWRYEKPNTSTGQGLDAGFLDQVRWTAETPPALSAAMGEPPVPILAGGPGPWLAQSEDVFSGSTAIRTDRPAGSANLNWLELQDVEGPGTFNFWWKAGPSQTLRLRSNNTIVATLAPGAAGSDWLPVALVIDSGVRTLRWELSGGATAGSGWIDGVELLPTLSLTEALDTAGSGLSWTTGGDDSWAGLQWSEAYDGVDAARSGEIGANQESWIETTLSGPGTLAFHWRVSSRTTHPLEFHVDGVLNAAIAGDLPWQQVVRTFGPGEHTVRWRYLRPNTTAGQNLDAGFLDAVVWTPQDPPPLAAALGQPPSPVLTGGPAGVAMRAQSEVVFEGASAVASTTIANSQLIWLEQQEVEGPATLGFWWRAGPQQTFRLRLNGTVVQTLTGGTAGQDWQRVDYVLDSGLHTLRWEHTNSTTHGSVWLDQVERRPPIPLATAL
ncbi:MAG: hypothetical protein EA425_17435, partial [Puniceicoccaceae bacterium]